MDALPVESPAPQNGLALPENHEKTLRLEPNRNGTSPSNGLPHVAGYEIVRELGRGGMGVVYKAWQFSLQRTVALKMILSGVFAGDQDVARFRSEALAVARLRHPNLLHIYEIASQAGLPFYAMEYVEGGSLAQRLNGSPVAPRAAARLISILARAMDYAHSQGVIHRDLKPGNILVVGDKDVPFDQVIPKITDFGLAKQLDNGQLHTTTGVIMGTPEYMAPEQAAGKSQEIGPATDVYSLGSLLYELLTGQTVFHGEGGADILAKLAHDEPTAPSRLVRSLPADIEVICLKCLEKEPSRRYHKAGDLADDLDRFLSGEPIRARRRSLPVRLAKWVRRRPAQAAGALVMILSVVLAGSLWRQQRIEAEAESSREAARENARDRTLVDALFEKGTTLAEKGDVGRGLHWLVRSLDIVTRLQEREGQSNVLDRAIRLNLASWSHHLIPCNVPLAHGDCVWTVQFSPDGQFVATGSRDGTARIWDAVSGQPIGTPLEHREPVRSVAFAPDGKTLAIGAGVMDGSHGDMSIWSFSSDGKARRLGEAVRFGQAVTKVLFSPKGDMILAVAGTNAQIFLFDREDKSNGCRPVAVPITHLQPIRAALFTPDGTKVVTGGEDGKVQQWDAQTGLPIGEAMDHPGPIHDMALGPYGNILAVGCGVLGAVRQLPGDPPRPPVLRGGQVRVWSLLQNKLWGRVREQPWPVHALAYSADMRFLASGSGDGSSGQIQLWEAQEHGSAVRCDPVGKPMMHGQAVRALSFSPDGRFLLSGSNDQHARVWNVATCRRVGEPIIHDGPVVAVSLNGRGERALTACGGKGPYAPARLWDLPMPQTWSTPLVDKLPVHAVAWDPRGTKVWTGSSDGGLRAWNAEQGKYIGASHTVTFGKTPDAKPVLDLKFFTKKPGVLVQRGNGTIVRLNEHVSDHRFISPPLLGESNADTSVKHLFALSEDDRCFVVGRSDSSRLEMRDAETGNLQEPVITLEGSLQALAMHPDGKLLATACFFWQSQKTQVTLWDLSKGAARRRWNHASLVRALTFTPDGKHVVTGGADRVVQTWNLETGERVGTPLAHDLGIDRLGFLKGSQLLASCSEDGTLRLWDLATGKVVGAPLSHGSRLGSFAFGPDGKLLLTGALDGTAIFWRVPQPVEGSVAHVRLWIEVLTGLEMPDADAILPLPSERLQARRQRLRELGGSPYELPR